MEIWIREMQDADWENVCQIYASGIATGVATFETGCPTYEKWHRSHLPHSRLVMEDTEGLLGWVALSPVSSRQAYAGVAEASIYMAERARGKGLGGRLMEALIQSAVENGIWTIQAGIIQDNAASIRLAEKCGLRMVGYREKIAKDTQGNWRNTVLMEWRRPDDGE
jgi:L-amino acid N-acyltransferase YncA